MMGIPYQDIQSKKLQAKMEYLNEQYEIQKNDYLLFDALRQTFYCVGRIFRSKFDYALMVFADTRYAQSEIFCKFSPWIKEQMGNINLNIGIDRAVSITKHFFKEVAQSNN